MYQEAFDKLLDCWLVWTITPTKIQPMLLPQSVSIFEAYLSWRLKGTSSAYQDDEEVDELDEDDRVGCEVCQYNVVKYAMWVVRLYKKRSTLFMSLCA